MRGLRVTGYVMGRAPPPPHVPRAQRIVLEEEAFGLSRMALMPDVATLFEWLGVRRERSAPGGPPPLRVGLITRNNSAAMAHTIELIGVPGAFDAALSREWPGAPKPHPAALLHLLDEWGVPPADAVMVGDSRDDMLCGRGAGALCVLVGDAVVEHADHRVPSLTALCALLDGIARDDDE